jgi:hypothetical protein
MGYNPTVDYGSHRPPKVDRAKDVFHPVAGFVSSVLFEIQDGFTPLCFTPITAIRERGRVTPHSEKPSGNVVSTN